MYNPAGCIVAQAVQLGCTIECVRYNQQPDRWYWRYGMRSSADQYAESFANPTEAAVHFLRSHEGKTAHRVANNE
jgi:hypothetical protein